MKKAITKIAIVFIAVTMLFATVSLAAGCDIGNPPLTLQQRLSNLDTQITALEGNADGMSEDALLAEIVRLQGELAALESQAAAAVFGVPQA